MKHRRLLQAARWALRAPVGTLVRRLAREAAVEADRFIAPRRARRFAREALLRGTGSTSLTELWEHLAARPFYAHTSRLDPPTLEACCPGDTERILAAAKDAVAHRVDLLGSGSVELGASIEWSRDFKSGRTWPRRFVRDLRLVYPDSSDVKVPWELSRLQWLVPVGQAYLLTGREEYAEAARRLLDDWITDNPYAQSINWASTMEAAMRVLSWTWLFHVFQGSRAWGDPGFRERFLCGLFLHGDFTERYIEHSPLVNGNHHTANVAALAVAGLFFGRGRDPERWHEIGWSFLRAELPRQACEDGVDFEASLAYHRFVLELFLVPALYRRALGLEVPSEYSDRLGAMARFAVSYCRIDGTSPLWGDADDARALPLGGQATTDHRYLAGLVGLPFLVPDLIEAFSGPRSEVCWLLGPEAAARLPTSPILPGSAAFADGGFFVMRNETDHVFIDCGPVGLAGRGGHGHNDCLSFDAVLDGVHLVTDCGCFLYTASLAERHRFRSSQAHNSPIVDGEEMNRLDPDLPWSLEYDAVPELRRFETGAERDVFVGSHSGYHRLPSAVRPVRTLTLDHRRHRLEILDAFEGEDHHRFEIPLHLAPGVSVAQVDEGKLSLSFARRQFTLDWESVTAWRLDVGEGRASPRYGIAVPIVRLCWVREGTVHTSLRVRIAPAMSSPG